jgi:hypothetical protein
MSDPTNHDEDDRELHFGFPFALPERVAGRLFGVTPATAELTVSGGHLTARFGPWSVDTSLANVADAALTGPYAWPKIIGPAHVSLMDRGITFASTNRQGVCIRFKEPVAGIDPFGLVRHPALTVTVDDPPGLIAVLQQAAEITDASGPASPTVDEVVDEMTDSLQSMTAKELRDRARSLGIAGAASMKKAELVDALSHHTT